MNKPKRKIIVAISGASGSVYARLLLGQLAKIVNLAGEVAVIFSENSPDIWKYELGEPLKIGPPLRLYENNDFFAPFASGSSDFDTMIICPCSMGMVGRIASGVSDDLITRAADVALKERRRLILVPRETPYNLIHLENMKLVTQAGAIVCPATPSFYSKPTTIEELAGTVVERILCLAQFNLNRFRWGGQAD